eukprot:11525689-Heterocapsa_arctica.AAC.1
MKKPWLVRTDLAALIQPLSRRCPGDHSHVTLRGNMAVRSGLYKPKLVEAIGKAIVHATVNEGDVTAINEPDEAESAAEAGCALEHRLATPEAEQGAVRVEMGTDAPQ